jgi:hypothetical protein
MQWFFAGCTLALLGFALRDEFRRDGSLFPLFDQARAERDEALAELLEFPIHDGWERDDVIKTYAEIQAL